ncbi:hypothetical protein DB30_06924 [Enhygromyxa salina]|uniref:Uncharacterized protein n=1 Tax=Enhygromyxa salina TaxID=215803 RepID=A0A0C2D2G9_9BACT|nr:hypothetical protein [Enhygromyxa salina]KIG14322.1 hypothetical protein DB30_06924 [Enhygromyxa salina]
MSAVRATLLRWGGILIRPRPTLAALEPGEGRFDWWLLAALFVLGSQIQHLTETVARYQVFRSFWLLVNGLAIALLTPLLVGLIVESIVGAARSRYRHLPLVALVLVATFANLLRQQGVMIPGPRYLPEMLGTAWAAGLGVWIRARVPAPTEAAIDDAAQLDQTADDAPGVTHD